MLASLRDVARIVEVARSGVVGLSRGDKIMR
jgi:acetolactate synthase-1/3 small subunit